MKDKKVGVALEIMRGTFQTKNNKRYICYWENATVWYLYGILIPEDCQNSNSLKIFKNLKINENESWILESVPFRILERYYKDLAFSIAVRSIKVLLKNKIRFM